MNSLTFHPLLVEVEWPGARITFATTKHRQTLDNKDTLVTMLGSRHVLCYLLREINPFSTLLSVAFFFQNLHSWLKSEECRDYLLNLHTSWGNFLICYSLSYDVSGNIRAGAKDSSHGTPSNINKGNTTPSRVLEHHGIVGCVRVKIDAFPWKTWQQRRTRVITVMSLEAAVFFFSVFYWKSLLNDS